MGAIGNVGPKRVDVYDRCRDFDHCYHCGANIRVVTPWNQPHICKEITWQCMPILTFVPFDV